MSLEPSAADWQAIGLTLRLAGTTTVLLFLIGAPLAWWLAQGKNPFRVVIKAVVALPLVLPPTVLGFYLLVIFGPFGLGQTIAALGLPPLVFSFSGLVVASCIYSLPFMVQPLLAAFEALGRWPLEAAATLRLNPFQAFFRIVVPMARHGFFSAGVLTFAHTVGEFGVVLMLGGNIPGQTRVVSVQIYDYVEALQYTEAHRLAALLLGFSFIVLLLLYAWRGRKTLGQGGDGGEGVTW